MSHILSPAECFIPVLYFFFFAQNQDPGPVSISYSEDESAEVFLFATFVQLWSQTRSVFGQIELQEQSLILLFTILFSILVELICRFSCLFFFFLLAYLVRDAIHKGGWLGGLCYKSFMIDYFSFCIFQIIWNFPILFFFSSLAYLVRDAIHLRRLNRRSELGRESFVSSEVDTARIILASSTKFRYTHSFILQPWRLHTFRYR